MDRLAGCLVRLDEAVFRKSRDQKSMWISLFLQSDAASGAANPLLQMLPIVGMIGIMYFLLFLPMQRQKKQQAQMLAALKTGDEVVTNAGIVGTIVSINADETVVVRVRPDSVKLTLVRNAIQSVVKQEEKK